MAEPKYLVGIDLGTSNCAMAFTEPAKGPQAPVVDFPVPQLRRAGEVAALPLLPSTLYLPGEHELAPGATRLPWSEDGGIVMGELARWQGARVPGRLITSAKSWLCHSVVDRAAPILPWGAPPEVQKLSPVDASARLVAHMVSAWDFSHPDAPLSQQEAIITVPASFDEAARSLTAGAAAKAGLQNFKLLEEPQAAFYDFIARHRAELARLLAGSRLVLVVDVGGGTSDFTLVQVAVQGGDVALRRIAVGEHLMLGGDNMDAALGRAAEGRMMSGGRRLGVTQWNQLLQASRVAKEALLSAEHDGANAPTRYNLSVVAQGSRLVGGALSTYITREEAEQIVLDGFFPTCAPDDKPRASARVALQELGLPYAQDPGVTRHLAAFLRAHAKAAFEALSQAPDQAGLPRPDAILLNGGVFNSPRIARRLVSAVSAWWPGQPEIALLHHESLDLAVARGAAYYGLVRHGLGQRIGGGAAHALYLGLDKTGAAEPAAVCLIPRGHEEGQTVDLSGRVFQLAVGKPVRFPLFSTAADRIEKPGDVTPVSEDLQPLPPIHTLLKSSRAKTGAVPVHLSATLTEIGTLELWCVSDASPERWRLEFELRGGAPEPSFAVTGATPAALAEARTWLEMIYGTRKGEPSKPKHRPEAAENKTGRKTAPPKDVKQLWAALERTLGAREDWGLPALRELWSVLLAAAAKRRRSPEHERVFFQLFGYCLRPGFGYPLDEWRCEESARLFAESVEFHHDKVVWKEFWILWRRLAGGLSEARQQEIWTYLKPYLAWRIPPGAKAPPRAKGIFPEGLDEMVRLAASLEHIAPAEKALLGDWIAQRLLQPATAGGPWTSALGRLGARSPLYGSVHKTVPADKAGAWVLALLEPNAVRIEGALFALAQIARLTGDRHRDLEPELRDRALSALRQEDASPSWQRMLQEVVTLENADRVRILGDSLPVGLTLGAEPAISSK